MRRGAWRMMQGLTLRFLCPGLRHCLNAKPLLQILDHLLSGALGDTVASATSWTRAVGAQTSFLFPKMDIRELPLTNCAE